MDKKSKLYAVVGGALAGFCNGLLGAGGGMLIVPSLIRCGLERRQAHRSSVAVILPLSAFSAALYLFSDSVEIGDAVPFLPWGLIGAALGTFALKKLSDKWIRRCFALFMIWAGVRLFMR